MPYKKKYVPRRKKTYRKRFKDSKINTRIERKISQIAKKEDIKNRQLLVRQTSYGTNRTYNQPGMYTFQSLPPNASAPAEYTGLDILNLTALGGQNYNTPNPKGTDTTSNSTIAKYFRITKAQAFLEFLNPSDYPMKVRVSLVYIPNANVYTAGTLGTNTTEVLKPNQYICSVKELRNIGIFRDNYLNDDIAFQDPNGAYVSNIKHTIIKSKQITLLPAITGSGVNSTFSILTDPAGGPGGQYPQDYHFGYNNTCYRTKTVSISKSWDINGKRFLYNGPSQPNAQEAMSNGNMYLTISHNAEENQAQPMVKGVAGVQYFIEKPATQSTNN